MVTINSASTVFFRALLRRLHARGLDYHAVADAAGISPVELWRLREYGTKLEPLSALRLCGWLHDLEHPQPLPPLKAPKPGSHHGFGVSAQVLAVALDVMTVV